MCAFQPRDSLAVGVYAGEEFCDMYHATSTKFATAIVQSQKFKRSAGGCLGPGIYLTRDRAKAECYRKPSGAGPVLKCRVKLGKCIELRDQQGRADPLMKLWHSHCEPCRGCSLPGGQCVESGPRYNSAWAPAGVQGTASSQEENCVYNPERIDCIEIIDGPGTGTGREFWPQRSLKRQASAVDNITRIGRAAGFVWLWKDDHDWRPYTQQEAREIERMHQSGQTGDFNISSTHAVNLGRMIQLRRDDRSRTRQIERRADPAWSAYTPSINNVLVTPPGKLAPALNAMQQLNVPNLQPNPLNAPLITPMLPQTMRRDSCCQRCGQNCCECEHCAKACCCCCYGTYIILQDEGCRQGICALASLGMGGFLCWLGNDLCAAAAHTETVHSCCPCCCWSFSDCCRTDCCYCGEDSNCCGVCECCEWTHDKTSYNSYSFLGSYFGGASFIGLGLFFIGTVVDKDNCCDSFEVKECRPYHGFCCLEKV